MLNSYRLGLANKLPALGRVRRRLRALIDSSTPAKASYSQHGEDVFIGQILSDLDLSESIYVDVGANHPTSLSNTYLLYRNGVRGVVIEPNQELLALHRRVRPGDIAVPVGCGKETSVAKFMSLTAPVSSYFSTSATHAKEEKKRIEIWRTEYLPILPVDIVVKEINFEWVCLFSIDTEGMDLEVLKGAEQTLDRTLLICTEFNDDDSRKDISEFLQTRGFDLLNEMGCNLIWRHKGLSHQTDSKFMITSMG